MFHRKSKLAVLAVTFLSTVAIVSAASGQQSRLEITPFVGYNIASDLYNSFSATNPGSSTVELTNGVIWRGRLTASSPHGGIEFAYSRTSSDVKIKNLLQGQNRDHIGKIDVDMYDLNFLAYQPGMNPRVTPFGEIGFGWSTTHPKIDSDLLAASGSQSVEGNTLFNFNFGLGLKVAMNEKLSTRFEGRWRITDTSITTSSGFWCDPFGYCYSYASDWYNSGEFIAGISYAIR
jgi:Outer membrane protein beta-barrel domain